MSHRRRHRASTQWWTRSRHPRRQWLLLAAFASAMLLVGLVLAYAFVIYPLWLIWQARQWAEVPCTVISSKVDDDGDSYSIRIVYRYEFAGRAHQSERYHVVEHWSTGSSGLKAIADRYPPGRPARCYVDPGNPEQAALNRSFAPTSAAGMLAGLFAALLPLTTGALWWFLILSRKPHPGVEALAGLAFFLQFLGGGLALSCMFLIGPASSVVQARNWVRVPCTVVSSNVQDNGENFRARVVFEYEFAGRAYRSSRYNFVSGYTSNYAGEKRIVDQHPPGRNTHCYVNPADPTQAVINRSIAFEMLMGLFPLLFTVVCGFILVWGLRTWSLAASPQASTSPGEPDDDGPIILKPAPSPLVKFLMALLLIFVWTGVFAIMVRLAIDEFLLGWRDWFLIVLLIGFLWLGWQILKDSVYDVMGLFSRLPTLTLSTGRIALGDTVGLTWTFPANGRAIRYLRIEVEAKKEFANRNDREAQTDKTLHVQLLVDTMNPAHLATGRTEFTVPARSMPSIETDEYEVVWTVHVIAEGETALWPRIDQTYPFVVLPQPLQAAV